MTNREAWEIIQDNMKYDSLILSEATNIVSTVLEKATLKKPDFEGDGYDDIIYDTWICPSCEEKYEVDYENISFARTADKE